MGNIYKLKVGDKALRLNSNGEWVEFTVNETYLPLVSECPEDYRPIVACKELLKNNRLLAWYEIEGRHLYLHVVGKIEHSTKRETEITCINEIQQIECVAFKFVSYLVFPQMKRNPPVISRKKT